MTPRPLVARWVKPAGPAAGAVINVTPLVDVVLVLLIIFMVVTPLREDALRVRVPEPRAAPAATSAPPPIGVAVLPDGALSVDGAPVGDLEYEARLGAVLRSRPEGERIVLFSAADPAPYRRLVHALDGARRAGAETLAFVDPAAAPR